MRLSKRDPNSFSTPEDVVIKHIDVDWIVNFDKKTLKGNALFHFEIIAKSISKIFLDVSDIIIESVSISVPSGEIPVSFLISDEVKDIGSKLTIDLPSLRSGRLNILINYETSPSATALQWLTPEQTLGKQYPYLFSQCQAIHARSILPCQDTPGVKFTYHAILRHPTHLTALMSAVLVESKCGITEFEQTIPIPSYLLAIAIGKLVSQKLGPISAVWAEEAQIEAAAFEFSDTPKMLEIAEEICGPYVWKRYDLLVMPPSFPYGGMENPCLTFLTPTILAGDKSLANVVAHEISHSWTGNLVTNRNFEHFWLNEGFTIFLEAKIIGRLQGDAYRDLNGIMGLSELDDCIRTQLSDHPELTRLAVDLSNLNPDDAFSSVPYIKGSTFLRYIEDLIGGPTVFEPFLKYYLNKYKYQSIVTDDFKKTLYDYYKDQEIVANSLKDIDWNLWLNGEGMPPIIPKYDETLADVALKHAKIWAENPIIFIKSAPDIKENLFGEQMIEFFDKLLAYETIVDLTQEKVELLASTYKIVNTKNAEIRFWYLRLIIKARIFSKLNEVLEFANNNFRMKYVRPIYRELGQWTEVRPVAIQNFERVRNQMMKVCSYTVAKDLGIN